MVQLLALKRCRDCGEDKERSEFSTRLAAADGLLGSCKACRKTYMAAYRAANIERKQAYQAEYRTINRDRILQQEAAYRQLPSSKAAQLVTKKKYKAKNKEKVSAHAKVHYAIKTGVLVRPGKCSRCPVTRGIEGHHEDYSKPLEVDWLCNDCHEARHQEIKHAANR